MTDIITLPEEAPTSTLSPVRTTGRKGNKRNIPNSEYTELIAKVRDMGLLKKKPSFYITRFIIFSVVSLATWAGIVLLALNVNTNPWLYAGIVPLVILQGILVAQYGFIAHEAAHRQVFHSNKLNDMAGLVLANLFAGLSYGFWLKKHNKHHQKPNQIGEDPDINLRVLAFTVESRDAKPWYERIITNKQGYLFPILLFFTGFDLLLDSFASLVKPNKFHPYRRYVEFGMIVVRQGIPLAFFFVFFNPIVAIILWMVFMCTSGFFLGSAFAPNHKGMPLVPKDSDATFFQRQVLTSRNIKHSWFTDNFMGGLNYQVEHHLFPSMPRVHLKKAHRVVLDHCQKHEIPLVEVTWFGSFKIIIEYLNKVGLSGNADPFECPMIATYRPRF